jgi:O-antigen/teichoic acid export membrane protein
MPLRARILGLATRLRGEDIGAVLARGASWFLVVHLAGILAGFVAQVVLARALGAEPFGVYVYVYNWMILLQILGRLGLGTASLRFVAAFAAREDWPRLRGYLQTTSLVVALASAVVATSTAAFARWLAPDLSDAMRETIWVGCLALPIYTFLQVGSYVLRGFKRILASQAPMALVQPLALVLLVWTVFSWGGAPPGAPAAMLLNLVSAAVAAAFLLAGLVASTPPGVRGVRAHREARSWLGVAMPLLVLNALQVSTQRVDILLLGYLVGPVEAGIYAPAARVATTLSFGLVAVNAWAAPLISERHARGDRPGLEHLVRLSARGIFFFTLPLTVAVVAFGEPILELFGPEFVRGYRPLLLLALGQLVNALTGPVGLLLTMTGRQNTALVISAAHLVPMFALCVVLIPSYGIVGAAFAAALTNASRNVVMAVVVWRRMGVRATIV